VIAAPWSFDTEGVDISRLHSGVAWITVASCLIACVPAGLRWLRVAQREHYLAGSASRFAVRWWRATPVNLVSALIAVAAGGVTLQWPVAGVITACVVAGGPLGLSVRGRTSPLAWTGRLRRLAAATVLVEVVVVVVGLVTGLAAPMAVVAVLAVPPAVDLACWITSPLERRLSAHFVEDATARLQGVDPIVVAVTGSYGKTSTKYHIAHLVSGTRSVVVTPASFNNRAGLARAINEQLADGTEVFVAEMGTYGPGEIADLCRWCPPDIAVITAIGPVHLERFGKEDRIVESKSEIIVPADDVVLPTDDARLDAVADRARDQGKQVLRCSSVDRSAGVFVGRLTGHPGTDGNRVSVSARGSVLVDDLEIPSGVQPTNLACAVAVALLLGVDPSTIAARLHDLPPVDHRLSAVPSSTGVIILDDTYNSNPAGARSALQALATAGYAHAADPSAGRRLAVVTPGMVELGSDQFAGNREFGEAAAAVATDLVIVGRTNRRALEAGSRVSAGSTARVIRARHRDQAVEWVRQHLGSGDVVLYENDLPDHYP
jgi:UDP-N-acetylmuramoyl-tripeptide--D-alanyl-D-alanine ligase